MSRAAPVRVLCYCLRVWLSVAFSYDTFEVLRALEVGRVIFLVFLCVLVTGSFSQWYIARLALAYFPLSSTNDAASLSFVPSFQSSGDSSLFFAFSRVPVRSDWLLSDSLCSFNWLLPCKSVVWEWVVKRRIFDPFSECSCICIYGPSGWASVMVPPLPCSGRYDL